MSEEIAPATSTVTPGPEPLAGDAAVRQLTDQLAEARRKNELARLDLEWEIERRQFLVNVNRTSTGESPKRSTAVGFLAVGAVFALGMAVGAITFGPMLLLLFAPFIALTVLIIASGIRQDTQARGYQKALARYEARCRSIRMAPIGPAVRNERPGSEPVAEALAAVNLAEQVAETRYRAELARLDREWEVERQKHYITTRRGGRYLPDRQQALGTAGSGVVFGLAMVLTNTPAYFPYFAALFALLGIGCGIYLYSLATHYEQALTAYQSRRNSLRPEQFRP